MAQRRTGERAREAIVDAAAELLREGGAAALTTRAVAGAAGVQAPTIYRLFGDKDGLVDAVAEHVLATYVTAKADLAAAATDPLEDLRAGWRAHVAFGLANPDLFELLNAPGRHATSPAAAAGMDVLRARVHRLAAAGLLRVDESRAVLLVHAAGSGAVLALLQLPPGSRDLRVADDMLEAVLGAVLARPHEVPDARVDVAVVTLRALLGEVPALSDAERALMAEWLDRASAPAGPPTDAAAGRLSRPAPAPVHARRGGG